MMNNRDNLISLIVPCYNEEHENNKDNFIVSVGYGYDKEEGFEFMKEVESTLDVKLDSETNVAIGIVSAVHTGPYPIGLGVIRKYETL